MWGNEKAQRSLTSAPARSSSWKPVERLLKCSERQPHQASRRAERFTRISSGNAPRDPGTAAALCPRRGEETEAQRGREMRMKLHSACAAVRPSSAGCRSEYVKTRERGSRKGTAHLTEKAIGLSRLRARSGSADVPDRRGGKACPRSLASFQRSRPG